MGFRNVFLTAPSGVGYSAGFVPGVFLRRFRFSGFRPCQVWCWCTLLPGRSVVSCCAGVLVLIPTGEF